MSKTIIIDNAEELIQLAGIQSPSNWEGILTTSATLVFENDYTYCQLQGAPGFELSDSLSERPEDIIKALVAKAGLKCHIT